MGKTQRPPGHQSVPDGNPVRICQACFLHCQSLRGNVFAETRHLGAQSLDASSVNMRTSTLGVEEGTGACTVFRTLVLKATAELWAKASTSPLSPLKSAPSIPLKTCALRRSAGIDSAIMNGRKPSQKSRQLCRKRRAAVLQHSFPAASCLQHESQGPGSRGRYRYMHSLPDTGTEACTVFRTLVLTATAELWAKASTSPLSPLKSAPSIPLKTCALRRSAGIDSAIMMAASLRKSLDNCVGNEGRLSCNTASRLLAACTYACAPRAQMLAA